MDPPLAPAEKQRPKVSLLLGLNYRKTAIHRMVKAARLVKMVTERQDVTLMESRLAHTSI